MVPPIGKVVYLENDRNSVYLALLQVVMDMKLLVECTNCFLGHFQVLREELFAVASHLFPNDEFVAAYARVFAWDGLPHALAPVFVHVLPLHLLKAPTVAAYNGVLGTLSLHMFHNALILS